jgi:chloride channel protein, CIC family
MSQDYNHTTSPRAMLSSLGRRLAKLLDRVQPSETTVLLATALLVGATTGLAAVLFIRLIDLAAAFFFGPVKNTLGFLGSYAIIAIPALGGLLAGPLIARFAPEAKGHGVPEVMKAIALEGGRIRAQVVAIKALASAACIGSGGSAGREGPIVQIGSALGSVTGQLFNLSEERIRNLVACGAAAGIAAVFNAPIAGTVFAMEVILGEFTSGYFASVVISAVSAGIVSRAILGDHPAFSIPTYSLTSPWEIGFFVVLGLLAPLVAYVFVTALYWMEDRFDPWSFPMALKPAVGGGLTGIVGVFAPLALGPGLVGIASALHGDLALGTMAMLVLAKILTTSFTLGSGNSGGVFAPSLFMGAMLGGAFGTLVHDWWPSITSTSGAYALVGMAAVFAAAAHAPITAVLIVFEMSGDYRLILPLMLATVISTLVSERLRRDSIYSLKLSRQGIHLEQGRDIDVMQAVQVRDAMTTDLDTVSVDLSLADLEQAFMESHHHGFPVVDEQGELCGIVTIQDLENARERGNLDAIRVRDIATASPLTVFPDEPVWVALKRLGARDVGRLPVVDRDHPRRLVGIVRRADVVRAYQSGILRRQELQHRSEQLRLARLTGKEFVEIRLRKDSPAAGKSVKELMLPRDCLLTSAHRGRKVLILHGDTMLQAGDRVTALVEQGSVAALQAVFQARDT